MENLLLDLKVDTDIKRKLDMKLTKLNVDATYYIEELIKKDLDSFLEFDRGFYYDIYNGKLFTPFKEEVPFTKLEKKLFNLLLKKRGEIVSVEKIEELVWKGRGMSIYSLRNMVKKVRDKTFREIITTYSNDGYMLN